MIPLICVKERAQGLIEYAFLLVLIALVVIVALTFLGSGVVNGIYYNIINQI
jgi:pilus assembly protein Flp/PilA